MSIDIPVESPLSDRDLVLQFESLGDSCELGLVQRRVGAEPLGMFRFAGAPVRHLTRAMAARFAGMADPEHVRVQPENSEYMIKLTKYDFIYHAHVKIGEADPAVLHRQQVRNVRFLIDKLIADLEKPEKIMVFRQNEDVSANDLLDFRAALSAYGPATLLWVQATRSGHPPGTVTIVDDTLMIGYVTRLARRDNAPDFDLPSWLTMLREAHAIRSTVPAEATTAASPPRRIDTVFGHEGNAAACQGDGWSGPENGFTWSIDQRSVLTMAKPAAAHSYRLEMEVVPFVASPALAAQPLGVTVNGQLIHTFDPLPRGKVDCAVPAHLLHGRDRVEIVLDHPAATSPRAATGQNDDRRLAVAFYRISLIGD
ncbi:hypothetical protein [Acidisphaera sp. S103]|uniref:hypothetical protein n=1 Tax=Acidisphaera sp. S103 TaxID=1747223 RepID=UPI00131D02A0|nr:hypothetical protein [Acidisphaera sp. S103]